MAQGRRARREDSGAQQQRSRPCLRREIWHRYGPLPTAIADEQEDLVRVLEPIPELARSWRLLTHPDLRRTARVSAFFDFVAEERPALKAIFTG